MTSSPLGEYIHYEYAHYKEFGTAKTGNPPQDVYLSYNAQKAQNKKRIKNMKDISKKTLSKLQNKLEGQKTNPKISSLAKAALDMNNGIKDFFTYLTEALDKAMAEENGNEMIEVFRKQFSQNNKQLNFDNTKINFEAAKRYRKNFYENIKRFNEDMENHKSIPIEARLETILKNFEGFLNSLGLTSNDNNAFFSYLRDQKNNAVNMIAALTAVANEIQLSETNKATYNGKFGEILVNSIDSSITFTAEKESDNAVEQILEKSKTGNITSKFQIDEKAVPESVNKIWQKEKKYSLYQIRSSQNKVDASITFNNKPIEASVKAYTSFNKTLRPELQEIRLLTSLITTEQQFANHWISLHSFNINEGNIKDKMDDELKKHMAYEALASGNLLKERDKNNPLANTFIVIDMNENANQSIYTFSIKQLLSSNENFSYRVVGGKSDLLSNITLNNDWADSWERRIYNILNQIHKIHVIVSYKIQTQPKN